MPSPSSSSAIGDHRLSGHCAAPSAQWVTPPTVGSTSCANASGGLFAPPAPRRSACDQPVVLGVPIAVLLFRHGRSAQRQRGSRFHAERVCHRSARVQRLLRTAARVLRVGRHPHPHVQRRPAQCIQHSARRGRGCRPRSIVGDSRAWRWPTRSHTGSRWLRSGYNCAIASAVSRVTSSLRTHIRVFLAPCSPRLA